MKSKRIQIGVTVGLVFIALVAFGPKRVETDLKAPTRDVQPQGPTLVKNVAAPSSRTPVSRPAPTVDETSPRIEDAPDMVSGLNAENGHIEEDLAIVSSLLETYFSIYHAFPMGDNADLTAAFTGKNPRGIEFISQDSDVLNVQGELVDRWGSPFFFHRISNELIEIRSGGPDGQVWTDDDFSSLNQDEPFGVAGLDRY